MKKNLIFSLIVALFVFSSCEKDEYIGNNKKANVSVVENRLVFDTRENYESFLNTLMKLDETGLKNLAESLGYEPIGNLMGEKELSNAGIEDPVLAFLLNPDGLIEIDGYIYKIDLVNELVYQSDNIESLSNINFNNSEQKNVKVFSTNENIFDVMDGVSFSENNNDKASCSSKEKLHNWVVNGETVECKVVYQKAGIYFSLQSKIKKQTAGSNTEIEYVCEGTNENQFYRKSNENYDRDILYSSDGGTANNEYSYRPYWGTRSLVSYSFSVKFNAGVSGGSSYSSTTLSISC